MTPADRVFLAAVARITAARPVEPERLAACRDLADSLRLVAGGLADAELAALMLASGRRLAAAGADSGRPDLTQMAVDRALTALELIGLDLDLETGVTA